MNDANEILAAMREAVVVDGDFLTSEEVDALLSAVENVLALHTSDKHPAFCTWCNEPAPCMTVRTITAALNEEQA